MNKINPRGWFIFGLSLLALWMFAGGMPGGITNAIASNPVQWKAELNYSFTNQQVRQTGWAENTNALKTAFAARVAAHGASVNTQQQPRADGGVNTNFSLAGTGDLAQFKQVIFNDAEPIGGLLGGPATLTLTGNVQANETLPIVIESNPSTGYTWDVQQFDAQVLQTAGATEYSPKAMLLGAPEKQTLQVKTLKAGRTTLVLRYHRTWQSEQPTRKFTLEASRLATLTDLANPVVPEGVSAADLSGHQAPQKLSAAVTLPTSFDWRSSPQGNMLTPIRDQGGCGSCWAFSTVGAFEPALLIKDNLTTNLSEQYLVSCNSSGWSCNGGWFAHSYHVSTLGTNQTQAGAVQDSDFPYTATNGTCSQAYNHPYKLNSWYYVGGSSSVPAVDAIKSAIYSYGPVSAAVCVGSGFQGYRSGIFSTDETSACGGSVNHAIVLVGWNDADQTWILRNSWNTWWGESGYMRIKWGTSNVGYGANYVVYAGSSQATPTSTPTLTRTPTQTPTPTMTNTPTRTATATSTSQTIATNTPTSVTTKTPARTATPPVCKSKPGKPILVTPLTSATVNTRQVTLDWKDVGCTTAYEVQVRQGSSTGPIVDSVSRQSQMRVSQYTTIALTPSRTYYWHIRACNVLGCGSYSSWSIFKVSATAAFAPARAESVAGLLNALVWWLE